MSNAVAQLKRGRELQSDVSNFTDADRAAIEAMSGPRVEAMPSTPILLPDVPFLAAAGEEPCECRPAWMHVYLNGNPRCQCGAKGV